MNHLNVRVAWHDNRWNGSVCRLPSENAFCVDLKRIREERDDARQNELAGKSFSDLAASQLPPCKAEGGAFMNQREWVRPFRHPYQEMKQTRETHGYLQPTAVKVPPFSCFAVPFLWMLRESQEGIEETLPNPLPLDQDPPFNSPWVFGSQRQEAISELFFGRLTAGESLVFFYTKSGHPLSESISRLVVGVGRLTAIAPTQRYPTDGRPSYPIWDRLFSHSIRPDGFDGVLLPYHEYLEPTGDSDEDVRRADLLDEIAVVPEPAHVMSFSYAGELSSPDTALSTLVSALEAIRRVRAHGIAKGPWEQREEWLNQQISRAWQNRGAFPGAGSALEALGMRLGTSLVLELLAKRQLHENDDPWPLLNQILLREKEPPQKAYQADIAAVRATWKHLSEKKRDLLRLLSRLSLSSQQAKRWFDQEERNRATRSAVDDRAILENPYRICETDLGDAYEHPVALGVVDRGLLPDSIVAVNHPVPSPSHVGSALDGRRVRAALVTVLRRASENGDALLSESEALGDLGGLDLATPVVITRDWLVGNAESLEEEIKLLSLQGGELDGTATRCLQLAEFSDRERSLAKVLVKRADKRLSSLSENWQQLLIEAIAETGGHVDLDSVRHRTALDEQAEALEKVTSSRLSALVGRAGTGKTTVLGALLKSAKLASGGILFLAPTGKARVKITQKTQHTAMTVAQFLNSLGRYDGERQRPLFSGSDRYRMERTVVIDECSMLTLDDLDAVLQALDLAHVQRVILVGDPNQLPPIGVGRPFADLVAYFDENGADENKSHPALARLTVELRTKEGAPSDTLRLASWYTREPQPVDADRVLSDMELGVSFNDLTIVFWKTPTDLRQRLNEQFAAHLGLSSSGDVKGFNAALGLTPEGWVPFADHDGAENFQILSPVRLHPHGVHELNRLIQNQFRAAQLKSSRNPWGTSLGDEEIVWGDKVILTRNGKREGYDGVKKAREKCYLANGEIGVAAPPPRTLKGRLLNVAFTGRPNVRFTFRAGQFGGDNAPLELAYVLTVHKAQGSEFGTVFVVIPKSCRLLTRELLYTALTRARERLVLLVEGQDASFLYELTKPELSETARRNSNLFAPGIRHEQNGVPFAEHLIHRTIRGELVRSKSELVIANYLQSFGLDYQYERPLDGTSAPGRLRPDFSFIDDAGDILIWEHLGMLGRTEYRKAWDWKKKWYTTNGFVEGKNLFTSSEEEGLDMLAIQAVAEQVKTSLNA